MKVLLVARDTAPSQALDKVKTALGNEAAAFLGFGKPLAVSADEIAKEAAEADAVLTGMSSSPQLAEVELAAVEVARRSGVPYGFYGDTYSTHNRPCFEPWRAGARFLFVINNEEAVDARRVFPTTDVVVSGNPMWEDFCFPRFTRQEVRAKLEVADEELMLLSPGGKNSEINLLLWNAVFGTVVLRVWEKKWKIFFAVHPGDETPTSQYLTSRLRGADVYVVTKAFMSSPDMIPGADIIVESASTIGIEAAHQRKPVVDYFTPEALDRLEQASGSRRWPVCDKGAAQGILGDPKALGAEMAKLLTPEGFAPMRKRQEEVYPAPKERGAAVKMMVETLRRHTRAGK